MKNNSVMKCCICNNEKICQFITIDNEKYHLCCIKQLKDNWTKLKEYISIKLYNTEYLQKMCGCKIDDINHILLDAIREKMQELEGSDNNVKD